MTVPQNNFAAPAETVTCHGLLFDMDGTIIDSTEAVVKHWVRIGKEINVSPSLILATSHGRRSIDVLSIHSPHLANWDYICRIEGTIPRDYGSDAVEIPGARKLLDDLERRNVPWAIVTSGTRPLVTGWLDVLGLAHPRNLVTAEDVQNGKPDPTCYLLGAQKLSLPARDDLKPTSIIVFEDAPAGVESGKAAGFKVVALATSHTVEQLQAAGADWIVKDMSSIRLKGWDGERGEGEIEILDALVW